MVRSIGRRKTLINNDGQENSLSIQINESRVFSQLRQKNGTRARTNRSHLFVPRGKIIHWNASPKRSPYVSLLYRPSAIVFSMLDRHRPSKTFIFTEPFGTINRSGRSVSSRSPPRRLGACYNQRVLKGNVVAKPLKLVRRRFARGQKGVFNTSKRHRLARLRASVHRGGGRAKPARFPSIIYGDYYFRAVQRERTRDRATGKGKGAGMKSESTRGNGGGVKRSPVNQIYRRFLSYKAV